MSKSLTPAFYEDAVIGTRVECAGSRVLGDAARFAWTAHTGDPTPRWLDGSGLLNPLTGLASAYGMMAQAFGENATDLGIANLVVHRPLKTGAVLNTTARVIGARSDENSPTGVVWLRVALREPSGVVQSFVHWSRLPKRHAQSETPRNSLPTYPDQIDPRELSRRDLGNLPPANEVGGRYFFEDYRVGEKIAHRNSVRITGGEGTRFARAFGLHASRFHSDLAVVPMPLLIGQAYALAHDGLELRTGVAGVNALRTPHRVLEGSRLRALTHVVDAVPLDEKVGALRLRLFAFADHLPDPDEPKVNDGTRYYPHVALDMDYWEIVPTLAGARGVARGGPEARRR